jgi:hypothetical protein
MPVLTTGNADLPRSRAGRDSSQGGGTSVAGSNRNGWSRIGVAMIAVAVVASAAWLVVHQRGTSSHRQAIDEESGVAPVTTSAAVSESTGVALPVVPPRRKDPSGAADQVEAALANERLYAKVTVQGGTVELRSSFCTESRLRAIVDGAAARFAAEGVASVRCVEPHGALVFTMTM